MRIAKEFNWEDPKEKDKYKKWKKIRVELDMDKDFVYLKSQKLRKPNISSHTFVSLTGKDNFNSVGATLLKILGQVEKESINIYHKLKGGIVEHFTTRYLKELFKEYKGIDVNISSYEVEDFQNYNQFNDDKPFTGVLDKYIEDYDIPVEIKSKEYISKRSKGDFNVYNWIVEKGNFPENEVYQGKFLANMSKKDKVVMVWGFVSEILSNKIKSIINEEKNEIPKEYYTSGNRVDFKKIIDDLDIKYEEITFHSELYKVDNEEIEKMKQQCKDLILETWVQKKIPLSLFSDDDLKVIKESIPVF